MPRPPRCRRIGGYPDHWSFSPDDAEEERESVILSLDEYEAIRLIDREGMTQEQCAREMGVARTTVTAIYDSAREKLARVIVDGLPLRISGGSYRLSPRSGANNIPEKGTNIMRIAVTYENGQVYQHFGHTEQFKLYDAENGVITAQQVVDTNGSGHGALAGFLHAAGADALICGGIGMGAQIALSEAGIRLYAGVSGSGDEAARALAEGRLSYDPDARCDHHHHEGGHDCHHDGDHGCGHHGCH
jgi:predicted DNA-binding protein (UPF0251 family)/predicted Fe-Mo cluster-binding NifX family protein